jgi:hypothetical protein
MSHPALSTYRFAEGTCIAQATPPEAARVSLDSPATAVMTDLASVRAACIGPHASLDAAEQRMRESGVRMLFVISDMPCVDGIVRLSDLRGSKLIRLIRAQGLTRAELTVKHVMQALGDIDAVDFEALRRATAHPRHLFGGTGRAPARRAVEFGRGRRDLRRDRNGAARTRRCGARRPITGLDNFWLSNHWLFAY